MCSICALDCGRRSGGHHGDGVKSKKAKEVVRGADDGFFEFLAPSQNLAGKCFITR